MLRIAPTILLIAMLTGCGERPAPAPQAPPVQPPAAIQVVPPAQVPALPERPTLAEVLAAARSANRDLLINRSELERSRAGVTVARSQFYAPQLTASWQVEDERARTGGDWSHTTTRTGSARAGLSAKAYGFTIEPFVSQSSSDSTGPGSFDGAVGIAVSRRLLQLHEPTRLRMPVTRAERSLAKAVGSLALAERELERDAVRAYAELVRAGAREVLRGKRLDAAREFLQATATAVEHGFKAPVERINAEISLNQAEADLSADRARTAGAQERLLLLVGLPPDRAVAAGEDLTAPVEALPTVEADAAAALERNERMVARRIDLTQSEEDLLLASDAVMPETTGTLSAEERRGGRGPLGSEQDRELVVAAKVELSFALDGQAANRAQAEIARRNLRENRLALAQAEAQLVLEVRSLHRRIAQLVESLRLAEARLLAERAKLEASEASWRAGRVDNLELTRAQQSLDAAEIAVLDARIDLVLAHADRRALIP